VIEKIGQAIRDLRLERDFTQTDLGKKSNVTQQQISYIERGLKTAGIDVLWRISKALDVTIDMIFTRAGLLEKPGNYSYPEIFDSLQYLSPDDRVFLKEFAAYMKEKRLKYKTE